jgi:hypothetical protein
MVDAKQWARDVEERRQQKVEEKAKQDAAFLEKRKLFASDAPRLFTATREAFEKFCTAYNEERRAGILYCGTVGEGAFTVRRDDLPNLVATIQRVDGYNLRVSTPGRLNIYSAHVFENGCGHVGYMFGTLEMTPDAIAADALSQIIESL